MAARMNTKTEAKNQNVRSTRCRPMTPSKKPYKALDQPFAEKFCAPSGTSFMCRVAILAKTIRPIAVIHVTTIEFVIGNPKTRPISGAF